MLEISLKEVGDSLASENPWWEEASVDGRYSGLPIRAYFQPFYQLVTEKSIRRAVILLGPRRVGKTVMMHQCVQRLINSGVNPKNILYVSIDTPTYTGLGLERLLLLFTQINAIGKGDECYVLYDEVQYLKNWETHLKVLVDKYPTISFVASGSAAAALKLASQESGAGRFTDFLLPPLTFAEYLSFVEKEESLVYRVEERGYECRDVEQLNVEFINYLNYGGYPEAVFSPVAKQNPARYIKSDIIDKVLLRDLPSLYGISDIQELNRLFTTIAYNTGNAISLESLAKSSGVSKPTISRYLEYLEAAFLILRIKRVDEKCNVFAREREFKAYLTNPSMRAALFQAVDQDSEAIGNLAETAIFSQWFHQKNAAPFLHYARWKRSGRRGDHGEVDIVWVNESNLTPAWAIEIKWSDRFFENPDQLDGLLEFAQRNASQDFEVMATTRTKKGVTRVGNIEIEHMPCSLYCYLVGKNTITNKF